MRLTLKACRDSVTGEMLEEIEYWGLSPETYQALLPYAKSRELSASKPSGSPSIQASPPKNAENGDSSTEPILEG